MSLDYGEDTTQYFGNSTIKISDGSTVVQNTRRIADATTGFVFQTGSGAASGNVLFTSESLTTGTDKGDAILNTSIGSGITAKFDSTVFTTGSDIIFYGKTGSETYNNTFQLDGQNLKIYKTGTYSFTANNMTITNSASNAITVYVEADKISSDKTMALNDNKISYYFKGELTGSGIESSGNSAKTFELTKDSTLTGGSGSIGGARITLKSDGETRRTLTMGSRINVSSGYNLQNVKLFVKNASANSTSANNLMVLTMDSKSMFETTAGLKLTSGSDIAGTILVRGTGSATRGDTNDFMFALNGSNINLRATADITQKYEPTSGTKAKNWINGTITVAQGAKVKLEDTPYLNGAKIIFNGNDVFNVGVSGDSFNSQAKSTLILGKNYTKASYELNKFTVNVNNEIGKISYADNNSQLIIDITQGKKLIVGAFDNLTTTGEGSGAVSLGLDSDVKYGEFLLEMTKDEILNTIKFYDVNADNTALTTTERTDGVSLFFAKCTIGDATYTSVYTAVPEPAQVAAILGAIALMFTFLKRRK